MNDYLQITTTTPTREDAAHIAEVLISRRLAACVQVIDTIDSTYWWKGKVERATEWLCLIKTERAALSRRWKRQSGRPTPTTCRRYWRSRSSPAARTTWRWLSGELRRTATSVE